MAWIKTENNEPRLLNSKYIKSIYIQDIDYDYWEVIAILDRNDLDSHYVLNGFKNYEGAESYANNLFSKLNKTIKQNCEDSTSFCIPDLEEIKQGCENGEA